MLLRPRCPCHRPCGRPRPEPAEGSAPGQWTSAATTATTTEPANGTSSDWPSFPAACLRQARSGATPISSTSAPKSGPMTCLKNGGPTVIFVPVTSSEIIGKVVPQNTAKVMPRNSRFWSRKTEQRVQPLAVWRHVSHRAFRLKDGGEELAGRRVVPQARERVGDEQRQPHEEGQRTHRHEDDPGHQLAVAPPFADQHDHDKARHHPRPKQDRALLPAPQRSDSASFSVSTQSTPMNTTSFPSYLRHVRSR